MFEKEAEEYASNLLKDVNCTLGNPRARKINSIDVQDAFKDGSEFGYNKAKEDADKMKSRFLELCNLKDMRIAELEKANEWKYPSKGELPKCDEETQLIFYVNCYYEVGGETFIRKRTVLGFYKKAFLNDDVKLFVEKSKGYEEEHLQNDVIAWKEIVLPKESE